MIKKGLFSLLVVLSAPIFAQDYFQQEVNYTISVSLDDEAHILRGEETFEYINNSPDQLDFIYIHLWPNAYKNAETALARQLYDMGNMNLEYASEADRGYMDSLDFKVDGKSASYTYANGNIDVCKLTLPEPLKPGEKIMVSTPFKVKIPSGDISRLGHVGESYQITQWYPKPAVYDQDGWHEMPYLTQGEFYSEYGSFDVSITLPQNYVVGATGDLQTQSEIDFLDEKATEEVADSDRIKVKFDEETYFPPSSDTMKTIRYTQEDIHDFAWFADKRFLVTKGEVELPESGRIVTSWAMFVPDHKTLWEDANEYLNDAIYYYSKWNGEYPYNQVTAVDGTISAGGGMEYPNVTVIGNSGSKADLEVVIVHEVGHNWFYGLLGSNERDHAWMDEGLNTLNEIRYMQTKYPDNEYMSDLANGIVGRLHFDHLDHHDMSDYTYLVSAGYGEDQPIELHSAQFSSLNYGSIVYAKTGLIFTYLRDYLGDAEFDRVMQKYYDQWHYKHPQPEDLRRIFEAETGKDLSWMFDDLITTMKKIDYKITKVKKKDGMTTVYLKNVGDVNGPIRVDAMSLGKIRESKWVEPGTREVTFKGTSFDQFVIDSDRVIPEVNRNNNYWSQKGLFHRTEPFKMEFGFGNNEGGEWNNFWLPALGYNIHDKFMLGLLFHNQSLPKNKFEYTLVPMFSFGEKTISGIADFNYMWTPSRFIRRTTLGLHSQTFGTDLNRIGSLDRGKYLTVQPYLELALGKPAEKRYYDQKLTLRGSYIKESSDLKENDVVGATALYEFDWNKRRSSFMAKVRVDYLNSQGREQIGSVQLPVFSEVLNTSIEAKYSFEYWDEKNKSVSLRVFGGIQALTNGGFDSRYGFALGGQSGYQDYFYENYMIGRNARAGFWQRQRIENHGGFKIIHDYGTSTELFTANFAIDLPYLPFVGLYADYGVFAQNGLVPVFASGVQLKFANRLAVYLPIYESENLSSSYETGTTYGQKIRITYELNGFTLKKILTERAF